MAEVLVVDDSALDRKLAGGLLEKHGENLSVSYAGNGREALDQIHKAPPDLVVCDLQMPELNGLELVEAVRREYPGVPVILMTARGSEAIASEALRKGAAGYVPKGALSQHLSPLVSRILSASEIDKLHSRLMHSLLSDECRFRLDNDPELIEPLTGHVQELLRCMPLGDEGERLRVSAAVKHALWLLHHHGNLELPIDADVSHAEFQQLAAKSRGTEPGGARGLELAIKISPEMAEFTVTHEGPPLDADRFPHSLTDESAARPWLSGYLVMTAAMDEVAFSDDGRSLKLIKRPCVDEDEDEGLQVEGE